MTPAVYYIAISFVFGIAVSAVLAWIFGRGRGDAKLNAAVARVQGQLQVELAQVKERMRQAELDRAHVHGLLTQATAQAEARRTEASELRDERAKLAERLERLPALDAEVSSLAARLEKSNADLIRASASEAEHAQAARSLGAQVTQLSSTKAELERRLADAMATQQELVKNKATLEALASRVAPLDRKLQEAGQRISTLTDALAEAREASARTNSELATALQAEKDANTRVRSELLANRATLDGTASELRKLTAEAAELGTQLQAERVQAGEKLELLMQAREVLANQFKSLANDILEEKAQRFTQQNQSNLGQLLEPLRAKLDAFQGKVEEVYVQEGKDRSTLAEQVRQLLDLNQTLSQDAKNLTSALKGSTKAQGSWGELVLERVLEASGLRKGEEYDLQDSQVREDGSRAQPDAVINLPEGRRLVVDSKVSLVAYERFMAAESEDERQVAMKAHLASIRNHIKGLGDKNYHALYGKSLDFVLMFVAVEPAFMLAVTSDRDIFVEAWQRNVLLVSPSTLLFVVRTVAHLWRQEAQTRNAQDIAKRGAELYDKLVAFVTDLEQVGARLEKAKEAYGAAYSKLVAGKGSAVRQAEMLKELGVKPSKSLPANVAQLLDLEATEVDTGSTMAVAPPLAAVSVRGTPTIN